MDCTVRHVLVLSLTLALVIGDSHVVFRRTVFKPPKGVRCLEHAILEKERSIEILSQQGKAVTLNTELLSKSAKTIQDKLTPFVANLKSYIPDTFSAPPLIFGNQEIVLKDGLLQDAPVICNLVGMRPYLPTSRQETMMFTKFMTENNIDEVPMKLESSQGHFIFGGSGRSLMPIKSEDFTAAELANFEKMIPLITKDNVVKIPASASATGKIVCAKPLGNGQKSQYAHSFLKGLKDGFLSQLPNLKQGLKTLIDLHEAPTTIANASQQITQVRAPAALREYFNSYIRLARNESEWGPLLSRSPEVLASLLTELKKLALNTNSSRIQMNLPQFSSNKLGERPGAVDLKTDFKPLAKTPSTTDYVVMGNVTMPVPTNKTMTISRISPLLYSGQLFAERFLIEDNEMAYAVRTEPLLDDCTEDGACLNDLPFPSLRQQKCASFILGRSNDISSCELLPSPPAITAKRAQCFKDKNLVTSAVRDISTTTDCPGESESTFVVKAGIRHLAVACGLKWNNLLVAPPDLGGPNGDLAWQLETGINMSIPIDNPEWLQKGAGIVIAYVLVGLLSFSVLTASVMICYFTCKLRSPTLMYVTPANSAPNSRAGSPTLMTPLNGVEGRTSCRDDTMELYPAVSKSRMTPANSEPNVNT